MVGQKNPNQQVGKKPQTPEQVTMRWEDGVALVSGGEDVQATAVKRQSA